MSQTQTHYSSRPLPWGDESSVRWAIQPVGRAVVFVHGFGGQAEATWDEFSTLLPLQPQCAGRDLLFYGYDSLTKQAPVSAAQFLEFLQALATDPYQQIIQPTLKDARRANPSFQYQGITLVAHSLGAIIVREALIQAAMDTPPAAWVARTALVLFAPAHTGAAILPLAEEAINAFPARFGSLAKSGAKAFAQVLSDLEPGSDALKKLEKDTDLLLQKDGFGALKAKVVVMGDKDRIVKAVRFCADPGPKIVAGMGHIGVCKPGSGYSVPIGHLLPHI
jgi:pimeloyl-ACP methyl ester carboxylesterase